MNKGFIKFIVATLVASSVLLSAVLVKAVTLKDLDEQARTKYQQARQTYWNEVNFYRAARQKFLEVRSKWQNFKGEATEQRVQLKEQTLQRAKEFLNHAISVMIKYLEAIKNKATNSRGINEDDRAAILAQLNADISWLQTKQGEINNATAEQLKQITQTVREHGRDIRVTAKKLTGQILAARIKFLIDKAEAMAQKLEIKINELRQEGKDVAKLEELLADFKEKIALAKEKYEQAKTKFQEISGVEDANSLLQEGHKFVREANQYVKQAHNDLVQLVRRIKQLEGPLESGNATTTP